MQKKLLATFFLYMIAALTIFPQEQKLIKKKIQILDNPRVEIQTSPFYNDYLNRKLAFNKTSVGAQDLMFASYDWIYNSYPGTNLVTYDFTGDGKKDPIAIGTHNITTRHARIGYVDDLGPGDYPLYGTDTAGAIVRTGWNSMLILNKDSGKVYPVIYDFLRTPSALNEFLWVIDPVADIASATKVTAEGYVGGWPRMALAGDGVFWSIDAATVDDPIIIRKSTDGGVTFDSVGTFGESDPKFWSIGDPSDLTDGYSSDPSIEANGTKISIFSKLSKNGSLEGKNGDIVTDPDSANCIYHYYSTDMGATWLGEIVEYDGLVGEVSNRPDFEPQMKTFDIGNYIVDGSGVTHFVHSGVNTVGLYANGDTIYVYPILYWNDKDNNWLAITDTSLENNDPEPTGAPYEHPANMLGPGNPVLAASEDGQVIAVAYAIPEYSGAWGNSDINFYPGDGGTNTTAVSHTDIVFSYSQDGGATWSDAEYLENQTNYSEGWPILSHVIDVSGDTATLHYMYYYDPVPGSNVVGTANDQSPDSKWIYNSKTFTVNIVGVNDEDITVNNFKLEQNYPNPFNPSTSIKYSIPEKSNVTLKVFDVLGREVSTLINTTKDAGSYEVNFDASNFASGLYIYSLSAGNFISSKKMMLLK